MERKHITERGSHTSITNPSAVVLDVLKKAFNDVQISPGKIEAMVGAKSGSVKFKHINNELYEMVVVHNGSKQVLKVFTRISFEDLKKALLSNKKTREWSVNYTDMRQNLDQRYIV